ncbi:hypothetical protein [Neisseria cinerea]|uniref:hypothetical protein n=2 Tax=Neisseria cinerea TaxID=483 RepID=UPI002B1E4A4D|nr:hypothetical protein [Neisseria cinerea]
MEPTDTPAAATAMAAVTVKFKTARKLYLPSRVSQKGGQYARARTQTEKEADMVVNELIIEKTGERHRLTDGEAEAFRAAKPLKRFPGIRITATYRRQDGGISVYARKGEPCR